MTLKQVKKDLQDIRYYYTHKVMFDKAENTGFKSEAVCKSEEYGQIVSKAPPRLYVLYYLLYVEGKTQMERNAITAIRSRATAVSRYSSRSTAPHTARGRG